MNVQIGTALRKYFFKYGRGLFPCSLTLATFASIVSERACIIIKAWTWLFFQSLRSLKAATPTCNRETTAKEIATVGFLFFL